MPEVLRGSSLALNCFRWCHAASCLDDTMPRRAGILVLSLVCELVRPDRGTENLDDEALKDWPSENDLTPAAWTYFELFRPISPRPIPIFSLSPKLAAAPKWLLVVRHGSNAWAHEVRTYDTFSDCNATLTRAVSLRSMGIAHRFT